MVAAVVNRLAAAFRNLEDRRRVVRRDFQLAKKLLEIDFVEKFIDHQAHGAFGIVGAQVDHRAFEAGVGHRRHGNQQLAFEISRLGRFLFHRDNRFLSFKSRQFFDR